MGLIEMTANALHSGAVALILLSVQKDSLELNIKKAVEWYVLMHSRKEWEMLSLITGPIINLLHS